MEQGAKALLADLTVADVGVTVAVGAKPGNRVVAVDDRDAREPDDSIQLVDRLLHLGRRALVIARRKCMAGVEANRDALVVVERVQHLLDLLESRADAAAEPRVVFDQQFCGLRIRSLEHVAQVIRDRREPSLESRAFVRARVEDDPVDTELVRRLQVSGESALRALAQRGVVAGQVDQINGVKVKRRMAMLGRRLLEGGDPVFVQLRRPPEPRRSRVNLYGFRPHRPGALIPQMNPARRIDMSSKNRRSGESKPGPIWHAGRALSVFVMGDLDLAVRGRTYREPDGPHSMVVRGRDLDSALQHLTARNDCRSLAVVGLPEQVPDLAPLVGRRLLLVDGDSGRLRDFAEVAIRAGIEVEWIRSARPPFERLAAALLPVGGIILAAGRSSRMPGSQKLLLDIDGVPMVRHVLEAASEGGCHQTVVVYAEDDVKRAINGRTEVGFNPQAQSGMASSIQVGLRAMRQEIEAAMILLGDQPLVGSRAVATLLRAWRREGSRPAVAAAGAEGWAPPVILSRELGGDLFALTGDAGARQVLQGRPELLDVVPAPGRSDDS